MKRPIGKQRTQLTERFLRQASLLRELQLTITGHSQVGGNKNRILILEIKSPHLGMGRVNTVAAFDGLGSLVAWCHAPTSDLACRKIIGGRRGRGWMRLAKRLPRDAKEGWR